MIEEIIQNAITQVNRQRDEMIIDALKDAGYEFNSRQELETFVMTRCSIIGFTYNNEKILKVDDTMICRWREDVKFEIKGTEIKITMG